MATTSTNEYLDRFIELGGSYKPREPWSITTYSREMRMVTERFDLVLEYAWAIPSPEAIALLARHAPLVEMGAGGGYWVKLLREQGVDVVAYDIHPDGPSPTEYEKETGRSKRVWATVLEGEARIAGRHPDRTLFLCWPPYDDDMGYDALAAYLDSGGHTLAYVGEGHGGCTGNDAFHELIDERMEETDELSIPHWPGLHDYLTVYRSKEV